MFQHLTDIPSPLTVAALDIAIILTVVLFARYIRQSDKPNIIVPVRGYSEGTPIALRSTKPLTKRYPDGSPVVLDDGCLRYEMAARAITRNYAMVSGVSEKKQDAYVNEHWRETWETLEEPSCNH